MLDAEKILYLNKIISYYRENYTPVLCYTRKHENIVVFRKVIFRYDIALPKKRLYIIFTNNTAFFTPRTSFGKVVGCVEVTITSLRYMYDAIKQLETLK